MNNINIRKATQKDINLIILLQQELVREKAIYGFVPSSKEELTKKLDYFYIAEDNQQIIGFVYGSVHVSEGLAVIPKGEQYLEIDDIYVMPEFRSKEIGAELLEVITKAAENQGIKRFLVYSASKDIDKILKFYRDNNFKPWNVQLYK